MKKRCFAFLSLLLVLLVMVVPVFADGTYEFSPNLDYLNGDMNFNYSIPDVDPDSPTGPYPDDQVYRIKGNWKFCSDPSLIYVANPSDKPDDVTSWTALIGGVNDETTGLPTALVFSVGDEWIVNGAIMLNLVDSADAGYSIIDNIQAYTYTNSGILTLWTAQDGWVKDSYRSICFSNVWQEMNPEGLYLLCYSAYVSQSDQYLISPNIAGGNGYLGDDPTVENVELGVTDFTQWLAVAVKGFFDFSLFGGFTIGHMLTALVGVSLTLTFLKFFAGG